MTPADRLFYTYNGRDCCCTFECNVALDGMLKPQQRQHYEFNVQLLAPLLYMQLRGIRYDYEKAKAKTKRIERWAFVFQDILNRAAGRELPAANDALIRLIAKQLCLAKPRRRETVTKTRTFKNGKTKTTSKVISTPVVISDLAACKEFAKDSCDGAVKRCVGILNKGSLGPGERGELSQLLGCNIKVNSTGVAGDASWFLYERCGFEKQYQKEGNKLTDRLASDDEALIKIWVGEQRAKGPAWPHGGVRLRNRSRAALVFLKLRRLLTQLKTLRIAPDDDGRMRCGYNVVGTETGRLTCYESPTGSGFNLQTVTKKHRSLFLADTGCLMAQCDLSGADGWTVAAYAAAQGDRTMLDDYKAGLKPAKIGVLMWQQGPAVNRMSREDIKALCKTIDAESWQYFGFKRVQHGSSYMMGKVTMSDQILTDSWKLTGTPVFISPATCEQMQQQCFFARYWGIPLWHKWTEGELRSRGQLVASNGLIRRFFGRKDDHKTVKQALAHLPQVYTTWSTMLALSRLWNDPENRRADGRLEVEPLHTVHDSLLTQFPDDRREWAVAKHHAWFDNLVRIAQEQLVIPFEMGVGPDWKNCK